MCGENLVTQASPSAGEVNSTESKPYSQNKMAVYMRQRRLAKQIGMTVKQWRDAGCPGPLALKDEAGIGDGMHDPESSPSGPPDAA